MAESGARTGGMIASVKRLRHAALGAFQNRLELFLIELQEEQHWLVNVLIWTGAVIFCSILALTVLTATIVVLCPASARPYVLIALTVLYLALAIWCIVSLKAKLMARRSPFAQTLSEFKKDVSALGGGDSAVDSGQVSEGQGTETGRD